MSVAPIALNLDASPQTEVVAATIPANVSAPFESAAAAASQTAFPASAVREVKAPMASSEAGSGPGQKVIDYLEALHRFREKSESGAIAQKPVAVAALDPSSMSSPSNLASGPAARNLSATDGGAEADRKMGVYVGMLRDSFDYATGLALVTKTGSSLAGSVNKLMSS